jgi:nucleotide-binding universal stress UspA family protein
MPTSKDSKTKSRKPFANTGERAERLRETILVGVDFSASSFIAIRQALHIAERSGAKVTLIHVGPIEGTRRDMPVPHGDERFDEVAAAYGATVTAELEALLAEYHKVKVDKMVLNAYPDTGIARAAEQLKADLVVVGTHGRTGFERFLLGSVAEHVVRQVETSVLVSRLGAQVGDPLSRILVPTDFSEASERAVLSAARLASPRAVVDIVHFWQLPSAVASDWGPVPFEGQDAVQLRAQLADVVLQQGEALVERARAVTDADISFSHAEDRPAHGIQERLAGGAYDLVVMGSHGRRGLRRLLLGSVAEATVRYSPCSVLVEHAGEE